MDIPREPSVPAASHQGARKALRPYVGSASLLCFAFSKKNPSALSPFSKKYLWPACLKPRTAPRPESHTQLCRGEAQRRRRRELQHQGAQTRHTSSADDEASYTHDEKDRCFPESQPLPHIRSYESGEFRHHIFPQFSSFASQDRSQKARCLAARNTAVSVLSLGPSWRHHCVHNITGFLRQPCYHCLSSGEKIQERRSVLCCSWVLVLHIHKSLWDQRLHKWEHTCLQITPPKSKYCRQITEANKRTYTRLGKKAALG